ncbi:MAG: phosphodiester glycosidase family protein [Rickettsiaceae bacterium]|nr:phosphodiester glycosidase family protein [Rickettsiaceae bacterium]
MIKKLLLTLALILSTSHSQALENWYGYERQEIDNHVIHIVTMSPAMYKAYLVRADNKSGRETVESMAKKHHAEIAINGGFFYITAKNNGSPSGTLIINGHKYALKKNAKVPLVILENEKLSIVHDYSQKYLKDGLSAVSGIPFLVKNGIVDKKALSKKKPFYAQHARTAIGTKKDGTIVIVVAEHRYEKDIYSMSLADVQSLLQEQSDGLLKNYKHKKVDEITISELKEILKNSFTGTISGLTMLELANLMKKIGCISAINLDGGGSSTLWIKGKVINVTTGDNEENLGQKVQRTVSDAIIFKRK